MPSGADPAGHVDDQRDGMRAVADVDRHPFGHRRAALEVAVGVLGPAMVVLVHDGVEDPVVEGQHVVAARLVPPQRHQLGDLLGELGGAVVRLRDVLGDVVELPHVVVQRGAGAQPVVVDRADRVIGHRLPPVVVDGARPEHLEVLRVVAAGRASSAPRPARRRSWCRRGATARCRRSPRAAPRRPARAPSAGCRWRGRTAGAAPPERAARAAGRRTMQGSATPPSWTSRFQRLKGVFPAIVQPHG